MANALDGFGAIGMDGGTADPGRQPPEGPADASRALPHIRAGPTET